ncbi:MAG: hypothetical protein IK127_06090 [Clostridia bacterium]|nr:hypothetical protein [Clostridia bacterium]
MKRLLIILFCILLLFSSGWAEDMPVKERLSDEILYTYYDNCLLVGDSLVVGFRLFVRSEQANNPGFFSGLKIYAVDSYLLHSASTEAISGVGPQLRYNGNDVTLAWLMGKLQPRRVFILAGLNDDVHIHMDRAERYIDRIMALRDKYAPYTEICFLSLAPVTKKIGPKRQQGHDEYNAWLEEKCAAIGAVYVDIATGLKGEDGFLPNEICRDGEYHPNAAGYAAWAQEMLDFAQSRYEAGLWVPAD